MGSASGGMKMKLEPLLCLGLALVFMCNAAAVDQEAVHPMELGESDYSGVESSARPLLRVPGIPKVSRVSGEVMDISSTACKNKCDSDKDCSGFQYVAAERLCRLLTNKKKKTEKKIPLSKAKKMVQAAVRKAMKKAKKEGQKEEKKALKKQEKAMAPVVKKPSAADKFKEADAKLKIQKAAFKAVAQKTKESARKSLGARTAEMITKRYEHAQMVKELRAAKHAQEAGLNFEEQAIMAKTMQDKKVVLAKAHKVSAMAAEDRQDKKFEEAKVIMKKGMKLQVKMKELKVKATTRMVAAKAKLSKAAAKHKVAQKLYNVEERKVKDKKDE